MNILKKILILISIIILLTGCNNNYQSLNDIAVVSSILIDKGNDSEYTTYIELYKQDKGSDNITSYFVNGNGNNIESAINDAANSISKKLYLVHTNAVIISYDLADEKINEVFNYLESKVQMNSNYYLLISDNINELINNKDIDNGILGEKVRDTLKYSTNSGAMVNYDFMEKLNNYISKGKDIYLSKISVVNNLITVKDGIFFSKEKIAGMLNSNELKLINIFKNDSNLYFTFPYNNDEYMIKIDNSNIKYNINNTIHIIINMKANIVEVGSNIDINKADNIKRLNNYSSYKLTKDMNTLINKLIMSKSDIIGFNNYIYKKYGNNNINFFKNNIKIKVNVDINKKGLINKTIGGFNE